MFPLLALLLSATSVQAWGVDPIFGEDEDSDVHEQSEVEVAVDEHGSPSRLVRREAAQSLYESSGFAQANTEAVEKAQQIGSAETKTPVKFSLYKFTVAETRGGSGVSFSRFVLQNIFGQEMDLSQTSSAEVYFETDAGRKDATDAVNGYQEGDANIKLGDSLIIRLHQKDAIGSYYWVTSKGDPQNDPTAWNVSGSEDGNTWEDLSMKRNYPTPLERHVIVGSFITSRIAITAVVENDGVQPCQKETPSSLTTTPAPGQQQIIYKIVRPPPIQKTVYIIDTGSSPCLKNASVQPCPKLATTTAEPDGASAARSAATSAKLSGEQPKAEAPKEKESKAWMQKADTKAPNEEGSKAEAPKEEGSKAWMQKADTKAPNEEGPKAGVEPDNTNKKEEHQGSVFDFAVVPHYPSTSARKEYLDKTHGEAKGFAFKVALDVDHLLDLILSKTGHDYRGREHELSLKVSKLEFSWPNPGCSDDLPGFTDFASMDNYDGSFSNGKNVCGGIEATSVDETGIHQLSSGIYELFWLAGQFGIKSTYNSGGEVAMVKIDELMIADKQTGLEYNICGDKNLENYLGCPAKSPIQMVFGDPSLFEVPIFCSGSRVGDLVGTFSSCI